MESNFYQQALGRVTVLCSKTEKCKADVSFLLEKWGLSVEEIERATAYLVKEKFIDEGRFADHFAHDKFYLNKWGKYKIAYLLRMKRIPEEMIREALVNIPNEDYEQKIRSILEKKARSIKGETDLERKSKLISFAQAKGFESDLVFRIAGEIFSE